MSLDFEDDDIGQNKNDYDNYDTNDEMIEDSDSEHLDFNTSQSTQRLNADSLQKILNDDVDDEEILFGLIDREDLPEFILNRDRLLEINKELDETNYLLGIINLIRRLMRIHDEVLNRWIGLDSIEETGISSIIAFIFDLIDTCFESICLSVYVQYDDLHVSIYDYTISMICSLIMTMNDEQISIVESLLFENLFSSTIKALMAADILCFMSRYCKSFAVELVEVLIKVMAEIYIEDVVAKEESKFFSISQTNLILLNLLRRILNFFPKNDLKMLSNLFLPGTCLSFQKNLSFQAEVISSNDTHELNKPILYDKLYLFSKLESSSDTLIEIFFLNFINSTTEYGALINLRLLQNLQSKLDYKKLCTIISKIQKFYTKKIFVNFCSEFTYNTLKFLNHLATINDGKLSDSSFQQKLYQLLSTDVWNECKTNYISQLNFFITLLNISCNKQFDQFLILISKNFVLNKLFQSHLKFSIAIDKSEINQQALDLYILQLKEDHDRIVLNSSFVADSALEDFSFEHFKTLYHDNHFDSNENNVNLLENLQSFIDQMEQYRFRDENEKENFMLLSEKLINLIVKK